MALFFIEKTTTIGELKQFLSKIPDESKIIIHNKLPDLRLDDFPKTEKEHELYIEPR